MRKKTFFAIFGLSSLLLALPSSYAASPAAGKTCSTLGKIELFKSKSYTCIKSGKKQIWSKPVELRPVTSRVTPSPTPSPDSQLALNPPQPYSKKLGNYKSLGSSITRSIDIPIKVMDSPVGSNVKLWVYNPKDKLTPIASRGLFVAKDAGKFNFLPTNSDGSFYAKWDSGKYTIDVVEPNQNEYLRKRYIGSVDSAGILTIDDLTRNEQEFFTVTVDLPIASNAILDELKRKLLDLATTPASSFIPASPCQLVDQVTPIRSYAVDLSAGFPKVGHRLPSFGRIKALIVPVDFSDVIGKDDTVSYFSEVALGVRDFYYKQSYGTVAFDFEIVPTWIRAPFTSTKFGTGGAVGAGDPAGYLKAIIAHTDGAIDYSGYEAVYFLVPKEMPMANMGWGPAITSPHFTSDGVIVNGATGGADMYLVERNGIIGGRWKWMAHETGHAFGLYDEDLDHKSQTLGYWGIMAMSWSNQAIELGAWDRYLQGWLKQSQVNCIQMESLSLDGIALKISPIVRLDKEVKSVMVPVTPSKILVIESRKRESLDLIASKNEGVLVYTVDVKKGQLAGGYVIQKRIGSTDKNFEDAALHAGDSITVEGVKITVTEIASTGDTVRVSRP